jgi:putative phosphoesterase
VKIGVISDTHLRGYDEKLRRILEHPFEGVDLVLHAGDLTDLAVLDVFDRKEVRAVCGNADPLRVRSLLPDHLVLDINGFRLGLVHVCGMFPRMDEAMEKKFGRVDCIIFGHTHRPFNRLEKGVLCFNPGSATGNRFFPFNSVGVLEVGKTITGKIVELRD